MKVATIDIGTNSMRLLVAEYDRGEIEYSKKYSKVTKIGKGVDESGMLSKQAIDENLDALNKFVDEAKKEKVEKIQVMATSALRDAKNAMDFIKKAYEKTGIKVTIMSGEMEAQLGFLGVRRLLISKDYALTIDIGGGSTEFVLGDVSGDVFFSKSENIGCVRLMEKFLHTDPPTSFEISCMKEYIDQTFENTVKKIKAYPLSQVIGIGGTFTATSSILQGLEMYNPIKVHKSIIYYEEVKTLYNQLSKMTLAEKQMIIGLQAKRADVIFPGVAIIKSIMESIEINYVTVSEYDNLEGLVFAMMK